MGKELIMLALWMSLLACGDKEEPIMKIQVLNGQKTVPME